MSIQRKLIVAGAVVFAVVLNAYLYVQSLWSASTHSLGKMSLVDECADNSDQAATKVNPNKMLFISCGGFLD